MTPDLFFDWALAAASAAIVLGSAVSLVRSLWRSK